MRKFFFFLIFLLFFLLFLGFLIWQGIFLPKDHKSTEEKLFLIEKGQSRFQIAENLEKEGLVKNKFFFLTYVILKNKQGKLQAGEYSLSLSMDVTKIAQKIISGDVAKIKLTIPEGFTIKQIEEKLSPFSNATRTVLAILTVGNFKKEFNFLETAPNDASLEGFLFPDTYYLSPRQSIEEVIKIFLDNFNKKLTPELKKDIEKQGKTIFEIITLASLIEKEVRTPEDKKLVSGISWKRLKIGMPLQIDATIIYITGKKTTKIFLNELQIDSPYNTYKNLGLPPGPISNPGLDSISAAIYPKDSDYWFYLSTPEGKTIFSKTLKEHNIARAKYLR